MGLKTETNSTPEWKIPNQNIKEGFNGCGIRMVTRCHQYLQDIQFYEEATKLGKTISHNPILLIGSVLICAAFLIPILCFIIFALINAVLGITGFLLIEVAVLTVAATVLGCTLLFTASTIMFFGLCLLCVVYIVRSINKYLNFHKFSM